MPVIILPEWTPGTIALYILLAIVTLSIGILDALGLSKIAYSKFRSSQGMDSRLGMFIVYALPAAVGYFFAARYLDKATPIQWMLFLTIEAHFVKRCLEVLFIHRYSGEIEVRSVYAIAIFYCFITGYAAYLHNQTIAQVDALFELGIGLFVAGELINFWHHKLLADLRKGNTKYRIPQGGLFALVSCPHYLGELTAWLGLALMSRHLFLAIVFIGMTIYLVERALRTQTWYHRQFPNYPKSRKAILPFLL
ncbi:MAG: hypothetical protein JXB15_09725 [Anaerolineales bacterium]|nr:hypothetical protein [Anaerolineales bacterium]